MHLAAAGGHDEIVETLVRHGALVDVPSERFCVCAPMHGLLNALEQPEDEPDPPAWSPLHVAICHSRPETAKLLLSRKASHVMEVADPLSTPAHHGGYGYLGSQPAGSGATALHHAAAMGQTALVSYLLERGIQTDVDERDARALTPFYYAYAWRRWDSTAAQLRRLGADVDAAVKMYIPYTAITPLGEACRLGHFAAADRLMDLGADVRRGFLATTAKGGCLTPLHMCCMRSARVPGRGSGDAQAEEEEEEYDYDGGGSGGEGGGGGGSSSSSNSNTSNTTTTKVISAGARARAQARMRTIEKLIARGAQLEVRDCFGSTPLMAAVQCGNKPAVRALLRAGADLRDCAAAAGSRAALVQEMGLSSSEPGVTASSGR